jgi:hypothetical protein
MLQERDIVVVDNALDTVEPRRLHVSRYLRDDRFSGPEQEEDDNLLERPRYRPTPAGPVFR